MSRRPLPHEIRRATRLAPSADWTAGHVDEGGDDHLVFLPAAPSTEVVLRIARRPEVGAQLERRMRLLEAIAPTLPWASPVPLSEVDTGVDGEDAAAVLQRRVAGAPHPPHEGDPAALREVLDAVAAVPTGRFSPLVTGPYVSTAPWDTAARDAVLSVLPPEKHAKAVAVWAALGAIEGEAAGLVHGDLAGHNMHWEGGRLVGVLDWDHAASWDPAINLAHLALWHGTAIIAPAAPNERFAARASLWVGHFALYRLRRAAEDGGVRRWARLLRKSVPRLEFAFDSGAAPLT